MAVLFLLGTLFSAQPVAAGPAATGRWAGSTTQLAADFLPPEQAADAVSHVLARDPHLPAGPVDGIIFFGRARQSKGGLCSRKSYHVGYFRETDAGRVEPTSRYTKDMVRFGGCEGKFAYLNSPASLEDGKRVLRWMRWAVRTAKSSKPLPFAVSCRDEIAFERRERVSQEGRTAFDEDRCVAGTRAVLAALPLDKVSIINRAFPHPNGWNISLNEAVPASGFWDVTLNAAPGGASVILVWKPFLVF